ncbi:hypothetical protein PV327_006218 [Microctonus hyperodae]|uniref:Ribosomal RNA-processing protein 8 n=1 Tax=Microctonus hyperodae TaxID=165561 RepID=A0AA39KHW6_MICHY|nr:hypothetical protein PV327_006218 [Microctonus hyperodae]
MRVFSESKWEASNKGDKLNEQLFNEYSKNQKKNHDSKLGNVKLSYRNQLVLKNEKNSKKRQKKIINIDKNAVSEKLKFLSKHNEKTSNKNALIKNLAKACDDNNQNDFQTADYLVADFGCGEARLSNSVEQNVTSLDLVAANDNVIACDMAHTPLLTNSCHVVVFCLSLMGSNLSDYLLEANRVLKKDGILKIAEIKSRFENVDEFMMSLKDYGFKSTWKDISHDLFYFMDFKKVSDVDRQNKKIPTIILKSCLYKKR